MAKIFLTKTQREVLEIAATRTDGAILPMPDRFNSFIVQKVMSALHSRGLVFSPTHAGGQGYWRISDAGYSAIGIKPEETTDKQEYVGDPCVKT